MALGNYINLGAPEYPSLSGAFKEFESGLAGIARMQEAQNVSRRQDSVDRENRETRRRQIELDAQTGLLNAAKERRAEDNAAMGNLMTLMKFQMEREVHDSKMIELTEARTRRTEQMKAKTALAGELALIESGSPGIRDLALRNIYRSDQFAQLPPETQARVGQLRDASGAIVKSFMGVDLTAEEAYARLSSEDPDARVVGRAFYRALGATDADIDSHAPGFAAAGERNLTAAVANAVDDSTGQVSAAFATYKKAARELAYIEKVRGTLDPERDRTRLERMDAKVDELQYSLEEARDVLGQRNLMRGDKPVTIEQLRRESAPAAKVEAIAPLAVPGSPEATAAFAPVLAARAAVEAGPGTAAEKADAIEFINLTRATPEEMPALVARYAELVEEYPKHHRMSPERARILAEVSQLDARLGPAVRDAGIAARSDPTTVFPEEDFLIATATTMQREMREAAAKTGGDSPMEAVNLFRVAYGDGAELVDPDKFLLQLNHLLAGPGPYGGKEQTPKEKAAIEAGIAEAERLGLVASVRTDGGGTRYLTPEEAAELMQRANPDEVDIAIIRGLPAEYSAPRVAAGMTEASRRARPRTQVGMTKTLGETGSEVSGRTLFRSTVHNLGSKVHGGDHLAQSINAATLGDFNKAATIMARAASNDAGPLDYIRDFGGVAVMALPGINATAGMVTAGGALGASALDIGTGGDRPPELGNALSKVGLKQAMWFGHEPIIGRPSEGVPGAETAVQQIAFPQVSAYLSDVITARSALAKTRHMINAALVMDEMKRIYPSEQDSDPSVFLNAAGTYRAFDFEFDVNSAVFKAAVAQLPGVDYGEAVAAVTDFQDLYGPVRAQIGSRVTPVEAQRIRRVDSFGTPAATAPAPADQITVN